MHVRTGPFPWLVLPSLALSPLFGVKQAVLCQREVSQQQAAGITAVSQAVAGR